MSYSDDNIPEFADVVPDIGNLEGDKMPFSDILNKPLTFTGWEVRASKYKDKSGEHCLTLQFLIDGVPHITFCGSDVLIDQLEKFEAALKPDQPRRFRAMIRKIDRFYKFCRSDGK